MPTILIKVGSNHITIGRLCFTAVFHMDTYFCFVALKQEYIVMEVFSCGEQQVKVIFNSSIYHQIPD